MALQNSQYDALMRYYQRLQFRNKHEQDARIAEAQARIPRLALIDQEIAAISVKKALILLGDKNATDFDLNEQIQALSRERTDLLKANGYPEDYLKMHYTCPLCQDTGYVDNRKCICFRRAISEHLYTQSNIRELLKTASFDAFSLDYYPEDMVNEATGQTARQSAATALQRSKDFVQNFDHSFENLFIYGDTGVGKTFLTYCIAKELLDSIILLSICSMRSQETPSRTLIPRKEKMTIFSTVICLSSMILEQNLPTALLLLSSFYVSMNGSSERNPR